MATWLFQEIEKYAMKPYHYSMDDVFEYGVNVHSSLLHEYTRDGLCCAMYHYGYYHELINNTIINVSTFYQCDLQNSSNEIRSRMSQTPVVICAELHHCLFFVDTHKSHSKVSSMFPPSPPDNKLIADVINGYCDAITPESSKRMDVLSVHVIPTQSLTNLLELKVNLEILTMHG